MPSYNLVGALSRGLAVLRAVSLQKTATVGSIHKEIGLDKATIVRMLETLEREGYIIHAVGEETYEITGRTLLLSQGFDKLTHIGRLANPLLTELRNQIGWPSHVGVRDGEAMVTVQATNELGSLTFNRPLGYRAPMLETSIGLAYLAFCQEAERTAIVLKLRENGRLWKASEHDGQTLGERITEIRARRFAMMETSYSNSQYRGLVWAIAVPILDKERLYGCINLVMLRNAVSIAAVKKSLLKPLEETASRLAAIFQKDWR